MCDLSKVAITRADEDLCTAVTKVVRDLDELLVVPGDCVLIKPNLVRTVAISEGERTSPWGH